MRLSQASFSTPEGLEGSMVLETGSGPISLVDAGCNCVIRLPSMDDPDSVPGTRALTGDAEVSSFQGPIN